MRALLTITGVVALVTAAPTFGQGIIVMSSDALLRHCTIGSGPPPPKPENQTLDNVSRLDIWIRGSSNGYCYGYIEDVVDAINGKLSSGHRFCIPIGTTAAQFGAVAIQYLREHPAPRNYNAALIIAEALEKTFPCR
jgi:hypothetical protein